MQTYGGWRCIQAFLSSEMKLCQQWALRSGRFTSEKINADMANGQLRVPAVLLLRRARYRLKISLGGPLSRSGRCGEERNRALRTIRVPVVQLVAEILFIKTPSPSSVGIRGSFLRDKAAGA